MCKPATTAAVIIAFAMVLPANAQQASRHAPPELNWMADEPIVRARMIEEAGLMGAGLPSEALLTSIVTWLANSFDLPANYRHPRIERAPRYRQVALNSGEFVWARGIVSRYDDAARTLHLSADWRGDTAESASVLIHEMVHHLQNVGGLRHECPQDRERLAYLAQERWLETQGQSLENSFSIDPTMRMFLTECYVP